MTTQQKHHEPERGLSLGRARSVFALETAAIEDFRGALPAWPHLCESISAHHVGNGRLRREEDKVRRTEVAAWEIVGSRAVAK